jgi:hypothetical protein
MQFQAVRDYLSIYLMTLYQLHRLHNVEWAQWLRMNDKLGRRAWKQTSFVLRYYPSTCLEVTEGRSENIAYVGTENLTRDLPNKSQEN